jgi:hypothetical protein
MEKTRPMNSLLYITLREKNTFFTPVDKLMYTYSGLKKEKKNMS